MDPAIRLVCLHQRMRSLKDHIEDFGHWISLWLPDFALTDFSVMDLMNHWSQYSFVMVLKGCFVSFWIMPCCYVVPPSLSGLLRRMFFLVVGGVVRDSQDDCQPRASSCHGCHATVFSPHDQRHLGLISSLVDPLLVSANISHILSAPWNGGSHPVCLCYTLLYYSSWACSSPRICSRTHSGLWSGPEPAPVHESAPAPPEAAVSTSELLACPVPDKEAISELFACPVTAKEAVPELSACTVMAKNAISGLSACPVTTADPVVNLSVLSIPVLLDPPAPSAPLKWSSVPSAPPWWSSAPQWGSLVPSAQLWWSLAPPWCSSAPPFGLQLRSGGLLLSLLCAGFLLRWLCLSLQVLHLHSDLALHPSPCSASTPPPSLTSVTLWGASGSHSLRGSVMISSRSAHELL